METFLRTYEPVCALMILVTCVSGLILGAGKLSPGGSSRVLRADRRPVSATMVMGSPISRCGDHPMARGTSSPAATRARQLSNNGVKRETFRYLGTTTTTRKPTLRCGGPPTERGLLFRLQHLQISLSRSGERTAMCPCRNQFANSHPRESVSPAASALGQPSSRI